MEKIIKSLKFGDKYKVKLEVEIELDGEAIKDALQSLKKNMYDANCSRDVCCEVSVSDHVGDLVNWREKKSEGLSLPNEDKTFLLENSTRSGITFWTWFGCAYCMSHVGSICGTSL